MGETEGCRDECASNRDRGRSLYLDARCFAGVENICWSACIDGLTSIQRKNTAGIIKGRTVPDLLCDSQLLNLHNQQWRGLCTFKCFSLLLCTLQFFLKVFYVVSLPVLHPTSLASSPRMRGGATHRERV